MNKARLFKEVARAALAFHDRKLWELFGNEDCFVIRVPGDEQPYFASVMGTAGETFGLGIYPGLQGLARFHEIIVDERIDEESIEESESWCVGIQPLREIPSDMRGVLQTAGFKGRRESLAPWFIIKKPGRHPRELNRTEAEIFLYALTGMPKAHDLDLLHPEPVYSPGGELLTLTMSGDPRDPEVSADYVAYEIPGAPALSVIAPPAALRDLPRFAATWLVGVPVMPTSIEGDDRTVRALVVADEASGLILNLKPVLGGDVAEAAAGLFDTFTGDGAVKQVGLPERIVMASRSLDAAVRSGLVALGVECTFVHGAIDQLYDILDDCIDRSRLTGGDGDADIYEVPEPDDLDGWKAVSGWLDHRLSERIEEDDLCTDRALARYFGSAAIADDILAEIPSVVEAFECWLSIDYRPTVRSRALSEKLLATGLPEPERMLLEARVASEASLYKIEDVGEDTLGLLNVASGKSVVVHDRTFPKTATPGLFVPLRVYPAGDFFFAEVLGPPLGPVDVSGAIEFLEKKGMPMTPAGVRGKSHLFGHLWEWRERQEPLTLTNTDGDELSWQRATFVVEDAARVRAAFAARPDVHANPGSGAAGGEAVEAEENEFSWVGPPTTGMPNGPVLAFVHLDDGLLEIDVNSDARLERARAWIEAIPGVVFDRAEMQEPGRGVGTAAEIGEPEDDPAAEEALRSFLHERQMQWLDESVPALGGKTPREMCDTEAGKSRVAAMIRTMPDAGSPYGLIAPPREKMFAELGIDAPGG